MRIFVASWFFPPMTSSEGIVSYKLLRNSRHQFDVCSSTSGQWSYKQELPLQADNIEVFPVQTDDFETWLDAAYALFTRLHAEEPYDALMTRSMPPESIELAKRVLRSYPELPWIASLADPLAKSPYEIEGRILEASNLSESEKRDFPCALRVGCEGWKDHPVENIRIMVQQKEIEDFAINNATALIFPCDTLKSYVLGTRKRKNAFTVAHSYDRELFAASRGVATETPQAAAKAPQVAAAEAPQAATAAVEDLITLTFTGHTDARRSLDPLVEALELLRKTDEKACERLRFRFIGNILEDTRILIYNYFLNDYISIEPSVDYLTSLTLMQESDWLIHVDTHFDFLEKTGGSIFFAGKLADYMGTDKPILALTGTHSPADGIVRRAGGACFAACDISGLAQALSDIASGALAPKIDRGYRNGFDAVNVAREHDRLLEGLLNAADTPFTREFWPEVPNLGSAQAKFLSICIPAYKVESYLDRCLFSLLSSRVADLLEVLVINDGSPDNSRAIALAYQEHYPTIVRLIDKENGGHGSTINTALEHATGTYFRIIDGDDWVDSINLTTMLEKLQETEPEADLVSTNYHQVYSDDGHTVPWMKVGNWEDYVALDFAEQGFEQEYFTMASTMIKTALLQQADFRLQEHTFYVDVEYILFPLPSVKTVMFTPESVYRYAVGNADQSINYDIMTSRYEHHDRVIRRMLGYLNEKRPLMTGGQLRYTESLFIRHLLKSHYTLSLLWDADKERGCARARDFNAFLKATNTGLYRLVGKRYRAIRQARRSGFSPKRAKRFKSLETGTSKQRFKRFVRRRAQAFTTSPLGMKLRRRFDGNARLKRFAKRLVS